MKIPKQLKVGGHKYKIVLRNDRLKNDGTTEAGGYSSFFNKIWIDISAPQDIQEETLFHEILEAINIKNDLELNHNQISTISEDFYQVLKDNKLIF